VLEAAASEGALVVGRLAARSSVQEGDAAELAVDTDALHFFDPDSGLAIYDEVPTAKEVPDGGESEETLAAVAGAAGGGAGAGGGRRRLRWRR
jgi:hypothetical protein